MIRRVAALTTSLATLATAFVVVSVTPALPGGDEPPRAHALNFVNILFDRPGGTPVYGPSELVEIAAGNINYVGGKTRVFGSSELLDACTINAAGTGKRAHPGVDDFLQPFADLHLVPAGKQPGAGKKIDGIGGTPNTVFGGLGGSFLYEPLGITGQTLLAGEYAIVVDECQDGYFDAGEDSFVDNAFRVDLQQDVPPLSPAAARFQALKKQASVASAVLTGVEWILKFKEAYELARKIEGAVTAIVSPQAFAAFMINNAVAAIQAASPYNQAKERAETGIKTAIANHGQRLKGLAADPPQTDFQRSATPILAGANSEHSDDPIVEAFALYFAHHDALSGVTGALLDAIERYQGADQVGDARWALRHARTIAELVEVHALLQPGFDAARAEVDEAFDILIPNAVDGGDEYDNQLWTQFLRTAQAADKAIDDLDSEGSFVPELELQSEVLNTGTDPEFAGLRREDWRDGDQGFVPDTAEKWLEILDESETALDGFAASVADFDELTNALIPPLVAEVGGTDPDPDVEIVAVGPVQAGGSVALSVATPAATDTYDWDLDGDGEFDDATGSAITWDVPGDVLVGAPLLVAVEATGTTRHDSAIALLTVGTGGNLPPTITGATLDGTTPTFLEILPGATATMAITATDPDGDPVEFEWLVNGEVEVGETASTFTLQTDANELDTFLVEAIASDGQAETRQEFFVWAITPDVDGDKYASFPGPDCLDEPTGASGEPNPANVSPRATEITNGFDDDCNGIVDDVAPGSAAFSFGLSNGSLIASQVEATSEGEIVIVQPTWTHPNNNFIAQDSYRLTLDWGDGTVETVDVAWDPAESPSGGTQPEFSHVYGDDLDDFQVEFCWEWLDDVAPDPQTGNETKCATRSFTVFNDRPIVNASDLRTWTDVQYSENFLGGAVTGDLVPGDDLGKTVFSTVNPNNWVVRTSSDLIGTNGYGRAALNQEVLRCCDDDDIGVLFAFDPTYDIGDGGDPEGEFHSPDADIIGITWRNFDGDGRNLFRASDYCDGPTAPSTYDGRPNSLTVWRRHGQPARYEHEFYRTFDYPGSTQPGCADGDENGYEILADIDSNTVSQDELVGAEWWGWRQSSASDNPGVSTAPRLVEYDYQPRSITVWIDGVEQLTYEVPGGEPDLPPTRLSFVYESQVNASLSASVETPVFGFVQGKGGEFSSEAPDGIAISMHDGADDTHEARISWATGDDSDSLLEAITTDATVTPKPAGSPGELHAGPGWFEVTDDHVYHSVGTFVGETCVTDDEGLAMCAPFIAEVSNADPVVEAGPDATVGVMAELSGATFQDPGQFDTHTATIDWGDGSGPTSVDVVVDGSRGGGAVTGTHTYTTGGDKTVEVCVTDQHGGSDCDTRTLEVRAGLAAPDLSLTEEPDSSPEANPDGITLGIGWTDENVDETYTVDVDWGDGSPAETVPVDASRAGCTNATAVEFDDPSDLAAIDPVCELVAFSAPIHVYDDDGPWTASVTVTDSRGQSDTATIDIEIDNVAPELDLEEPSVDGANVELVGTYTDASPVDTHRFVVDWGDGTTSDEPATGGVVDAAHTYDDDGPFTIEACIVDDDGAEKCVESSTDPTVEPPEPDVPFIISTVPARFVDTRANGETVDDRFEKIGARDDGEITRIEITGRGSIPADGPTAAVLNLTAIQPRGQGFFTVYPCTDEVPLTSALNYADDDRGNEIIAKLSDSGELCVFAATATHFVIDVVGYVPAGSEYSPLSPARIADTRPGAETVDDESAGLGKRSGGSVTEIRVAGRGGVPDDGVDSVVLNLTSVRPEAIGFFTVYPCTDDVPLASALNYLDDNRGNEIIAKLSPTGSICVFASDPTHLTVDVVGHIPTGADYTGIDPARLADTRDNGVTVDGESAGIGRRAPGSITEIQITGRADVPDAVDAAVVNLTSVAPERQGFFTVYPCTDDVPLASALNYLDDNRGNEIIAKLSPSGSVCVFASDPTHLTIDVVGYIAG